MNAASVTETPVTRNSASAAAWAADFGTRISVRPGASMRRDAGSSRSTSAITSTLAVARDLSVRWNRVRQLPATPRREDSERAANDQLREGRIGGRRRNSTSAQETLDEALAIVWAPAVESNIRNPISPHSRS